MVDARLDTQLLITVSNKTGTLSDVTDVVSSAGINLLAVCAYAVDNNGMIMFVTDDNKKAKKLLEHKKYDVREEEAVLVLLDHKPGMLQSVTKRIAEFGIDITVLYGSVEPKGKKSQIVLIAEDNKSVVAAIKTM